MNEIQLVGKLLAHEARRAQRIATHQAFSLVDDPLVVATLALAGEDVTVHAIALGRLSEEPEVLVVGDPRVRDQQFAVFGWMLERIEPYFLAARASGSFPQVLVPSVAHARHFDLLAERLRYNDIPEVRRLGELLSYPAHRYPFDGQLALLTASESLSAHFATGQDPGEDQHLLALLTWIDPPAGEDLLDALERVERVPMGINTDPEFDRLQLEPRLKALNHALRANAGRAEIASRTSDIHDVLAPVVVHAHAACRRSFRILLALGLPPLRDVTDIASKEIQEFRVFMEARDAGRHFSIRDSPKAATYGFLAREAAAENAEAALLGGDLSYRAAARMKGRVLRGTVRSVSRTRVRPQLFETTFEIASSQPVLKLRPLDELTWIDDARVRVVVTRLVRDGATTIVTVRMLKGMRSPGPPSEGTIRDWCERTPNWSNDVRLLRQLGERLRVVPWTHDTRPAPVLPPGARLDDPLGFVENLR